MLNILLSKEELWYVSLSATSLLGPALLNKHINNTMLCSVSNTFACSTACSPHSTCRSRRRQESFLRCTIQPFHDCWHLCAPMRPVHLFNGNWNCDVSGMCASSPWISSVPPLPYEMDMAQILVKVRFVAASSKLLQAPSPSLLFYIKTSTKDKTTDTRVVCGQQDTICPNIPFVFQKAVSRCNTKKTHN